MWARPERHPARAGIALKEFERLPLRPDVTNLAQLTTASGLWDRIRVRARQILAPLGVTARFASEASLNNSVLFRAPPKFAPRSRTIGSAYGAYG